MRILILGTGKGSFAVRGQQLGEALQARVSTELRPSDLDWADVVVLVKHAGPLWARAVREARKPLVWDALDFWQQPAQNGWTEGEAVAALRTYLATIRPSVTIGATQAMAEAAGGVYLPHHARPGLAALPASDVVRTVAYEGTKKYLGRWGKAVQAECARRGWTFVINPPHLSGADIIVAFRDGQWDGWACRNWKSGVKLVNAIAAGRPVITQPSAAWDEIQPAGSAIDTPDELSAEFDHWSDLTRRANIARGRAAFSLGRVAADYGAILARAVLGRAA